MPVIAASNDGSDRVSNGATGDSESDGEIGDSAGPGSGAAGGTLMKYHFSFSVFMCV